MSVAVFADGEHVHVIIGISTTTATTATTATIAMIASTFVLFLDSAEARHFDCFWTPLFGTEVILAF